MTEDLVGEVRAELTRPRAGRAFVSFLRNEVGWRAARTDFSGDLAGLEVPTLLIHGDGDPLAALGATLRAHRLVPRSELAVFEGCGHWPPRERPGEFVRAVEGFLARRA